jgi:hypothetical protein
MEGERPSLSLGLIYLLCIVVAVKATRLHCICFGLALALGGRHPGNGIMFHVAKHFQAQFCYPPTDWVGVNSGVGTLVFSVSIFSALRDY